MAKSALMDLSVVGESALKARNNGLRLVIAILVVLLVLLFPGHPDQFTLNTLWQLPVELPVIVLALLFAPRPLRKPISALLAFMAFILMLLRLADIGSYLAFDRRFNPVLELHLLSDGWNLASTSTGPLQALLIVALAWLVLIFIVWILYRCLLRIANVSPRRRAPLMLFAGIAAALITGGLYAENRFEYNSAAQAELIPEFSQRIARINDAIVDQQLFIEQLQRDTVLDEQTPTFSALQGKDVIIVFVESYGRGYLDAERFATLARERLASVQGVLDNSGMQSKSGWLTSPIRGGRSWLAHSTFQAGLEIDSQARYDRLVTTKRPSFSALFEMAGWNTVGVMPAIQFEWPEGSWYDYQSLHVAKDMQYQGERFGYVTMPDQYTMSHFQRKIREKSDRPVMATIALLTTHAPWTPIPEKLDWSAIGDGSIYDGSMRYGDKISWKYRSKVQDMFAQSFDYTLDILGEYIALYGDNAVVVILGDHQPPPVINGWGKSGDVPVHVISNDAAIMRRLPEEYWVDGMIPSAAVASQPMRNMRKTFSTLFE